MKEDRDLSFLVYCKNEVLKILVGILTHDVVRKSPHIRIVD